MRVPAFVATLIRPLWLFAAAALLEVALLPLAGQSQELSATQADAVASPQALAKAPPGPQNSDVLVPPAPSIDEPPSTGVSPASEVLERETPLPSLEKVFVPPAPAAPAPQPVTTTNESEWVVTITPLEKQQKPALVANYETIYNSIPYRRAEYLANPSYRHDTTVEILFGQLRPTVINRTDTPQRVVNPRPQLTQPYPLSKGELYSYWPLLQYGSPLPLLSPIQ